MRKYHLKNEKQLFSSIQELCDYVAQSGICPSAEIYIDGEATGEEVSEYLVY
tara:strand:+ start:339 stop:494 length:156 start_codon:yes stop_codon:yes gene_type:complete